MTERLMPLGAHIEELRGRIIKSLLAVGAGFLLCYSSSESLLDLFTKDMEAMIFVSPAEAFFSRLKISILAGIVIASPVILYQAWVFISSGLMEKEKRPVLKYTGLSLILFIAGILFAYKVILPIAIRFLMSFSTYRLKPFISVGNYISFIWTVLLIFGASFQVPLVVLFLTRMGIVSLKSLTDNRRTVIVLVFIVGAVLTPPDVFTQILLAVPLLILYEIGILLARMKRKG